MIHTYIHFRPLKILMVISPTFRKNIFDETCWRRSTNCRGHLHQISYKIHLLASQSRPCFFLKGGPFSLERGYFMNFSYFSVKTCLSNTTSICCHQTDKNSAKSIDYYRDLKQNKTIMKKLKHSSSTYHLDDDILNDILPFVSN